MSKFYCMVIVFVAGVFAVNCFPSRRSEYQSHHSLDSGYRDTRDLEDRDTFLQDTDRNMDYPEVILTNKRAEKRATLNQLLQRLIALYGNNDIAWSGSSTHMRFGPGGKR